MWTRSIPSIATFFLASCTVVNSEGVREGHPEAAEFCSPLPVDEAVSRLRSAWMHCYGGSEPDHTTLMVKGTAVSVPVMDASMRIDEEHQGDRSSLVLRMNHDDAIVLLADFSKDSSCGTKVSARGWNGPWHRSAKNTGAWLLDPNAPGPMFACK